MKASTKDLELAVEMTLREIQGNPNLYYTGSKRLESYPGPRGDESVHPFTIVQGTADTLESFALHLAVMLSGEAYAIGNTGFPTMVEIHNVMEIRRELLTMASVYENEEDEPATFDLWIDEA